MLLPQEKSKVGNIIAKGGRRRGEHSPESMYKITSPNCVSKSTFFYSKVFSKSVCREKHGALCDLSPLRNGEEDWNPKPFILKSVTSTKWTKI